MAEAPPGSPPPGDTCGAQALPRRLTLILILTLTLTLTLTLIGRLSLDAYMAALVVEAQRAAGQGTENEGWGRVRGRAGLLVSLERRRRIEEVTAEAPHVSPFLNF